MKRRDTTCMVEWEIMAEEKQKLNQQGQRKVKENLVLKSLLVSVSSCYLTGCSIFTKPSITDVVQQNVSATAADVTFEKIQGFNNLSILSVIGGFCLLAGMILLVLTRGSMGWRGVIGGVSMIVVNYLIALYAAWIFIPVVVITGAISLAWGWRIIVRIINDDDIKIKEIVNV